MNLWDYVVVAQDRSTGMILAVYGGFADVGERDDVCRRLEASGWRASVEVLRAVPPDVGPMPA